jgi:HAD superfamily hydrolase (TIGR01509 family)
MIDWRNITTVFLDMDGTLLDLNFDNHFWLEFAPLRYAERHGVSVDEARIRLMPRFKATEGRLEWYCLDYWSEQLDLDITGMKAEIAGLIAVLPHVTEFLEFLQSQGQRVVLATNAHPKSLGLKMNRTCLHAFFDNIVSAHALGYPKEEAAFWQRLGTVEPLDPQTTLLVDDSLPVLRSARQYGIAHQIAIRKNDSRRPSRDITEFPAIEDFRELMPPVVAIP